MKRTLTSLSILIFCFLFTVNEAYGRRHSRFSRMDTVSSASELDSIFNQPLDSIYVILAPGDYHLKPKQDIDTSLETRDGMPVAVHHTYGLKITAKFVVIEGTKAYGAAIYTHAGYGLYFVNCPNARVEGVIITGGIRDEDSLATDAGIVVKNSKIKIINNIIFENIGDPQVIKKTTAGVMGICGREDSYTFIFNNQIARNSWNGIGIYKRAKSTITGNLVDGVDNYDIGDHTIGGGRGIGIFLTRDAKATVETNVVKRYWRGIGIYVNADALISENLIEDIQTWGMMVYDADTGRPKAHIEKNVVYKTGACGVSIVRYLESKGDVGYFRDNIVVNAARNRKYDGPDKFCFQCALAVHGRPDNFDISNNVFYDNYWIYPCTTNLDLSMQEFAQVLQSRFSTLPLRWYSGYSEFIQRFYIYLGPKPPTQ